MRFRLPILLAIALLCGCTNDDIIAQTMADEKLNITIGDESRTVMLVDNVGTRALMQALQAGSITFAAHDYGDFEKVGALGQSLPTDDHKTTTSAGDVVLYNGNNICIFYGSNSWSYTRIGRLENMSADEVRRFVRAGEGQVEVTLSRQSVGSTK